MLVINPDECIDCGVCEPECPAEAIIPDSDSNSEKWLSLNEEFSSKWPNIVRKGTPPEDGEKYQNEGDKFKKYFSEKPEQFRRVIIKITNKLILRQLAF